MLHRVPEWPEQLAGFIKSRAKVPFKFGENDCALFALDAIAAITGTDLAADIRGTYSDQDGANAVLTEENLMRIAVVNGITQVPVLMAHRGDVLLFMQRTGPTLLVSDGLHGWGPGEDGAKRCALARDCVKAFHIPF